MKQQVILMALTKKPMLVTHRTGIIRKGDKVELGLPDGCIGILYAFESKKAARAWGRKGCPLMPFEEKK